jgi:hypothetical protein
VARFLLLSVSIVSAAHPSSSPLANVEVAALLFMKANSVLN